MQHKWLQEQEIRVLKKKKQENEGWGTHSNVARRPLKLEADPLTHSDRKALGFESGQGKMGVFEQREREREIK